MLNLSHVHRAVAVDAARAPRNRPRDVEVGDDVEAVAAASGDKGVHAAQGVGVETGAARLEGVGVAADETTIVMVEADCIVADARHVGDCGVGLVLVREIRAGADVRAPEADSLSGTVLEFDTAATRHYAPVDAAWSVRCGEVREVQSRTRLDVMLHGERNPGGGGSFAASDE